MSGFETTSVILTSCWTYSDHSKSAVLGSQIVNCKLQIPRGGSRGGGGGHHENMHTLLFGAGVQWSRTARLPMSTPLTREGVKA